MLQLNIKNLNTVHYLIRKIYINIVAQQPQLLQELLQNAAKMRIRRMIAPKKKRSDLTVPPMVREQWEKGTEEKNEMAQLLMDTNWNKDHADFRTW